MIISLSFLLSTLVYASSNLGDTDKAWNYLGVTGYAGHLTMNALTGSSIFYWLFESIDGNITTDSRPLIMWLEGGPGCSGSFSMIWQGVSPILVNTNTQPFRTNNSYTWATDYHLLSIDFPYGTGFSFANSESDLKNNTLDATYYLYKFLSKLGKKYPSWFNRDFYIFGYSYAGHWVPGIGYHILTQNQLNNGFNINLKGIGIAGPLVNPKIHFTSYAGYATATSTINDNQASIFQYYQSLISKQISLGQYAQASGNADNLLEVYESFTDGADLNNVRGFDDNNEVNFDNWITSTSTREMLNAGNAPWVDCNQSVYNYFYGDISNSTDSLLSFILESGIRVLLFSGQDDFIIPSSGVQNMISALGWSGIPSFLASPKVVWKVDGEVAGYVQSNKNLTFALVLKSGHLTPYNQPVNTKYLVESFIEGKVWN